MMENENDTKRQPRVFAVSFDGTTNAFKNIKTYEFVNLNNFKLLLIQLIA